MSLNLLNYDELGVIQRELEHALHNHIQWHHSLLRTLSCRLKGDKHDISAEPHKECLFGQWYYEHAPQKLREHPGYVAIGESHRFMHQMAARMIQASNMGNMIDPSDYDNFSNSMERLRLELASLKREIESSLYTHDPLTGAVNRVDMLPALRALHEIVKRSGQESCIVMMDLDNFKSINDRLGHLGGDQVLSQTIRYIISKLRVYDKIFRYGGEEFLISLQNTNADNCHKRIEEIRKGIADLSITIEGHEAIRETLSFGITELDPNASVEDCIARADQALYHAKADNRNCTRIWSPALAPPQGKK